MYESGAAGERHPWESIYGSSVRPPRLDLCRTLTKACPALSLRVTCLPHPLFRPAAVERGRELRADYKLIARALTRKGNALAKQGRLEEAVGAYHKSLTEHRCLAVGVPAEAWSKAGRVLPRGPLLAVCGLRLRSTKCWHSKGA